MLPWDLLRQEETWNMRKCMYWDSPASILLRGKVILGAWRKEAAPEINTIVWYQFFQLPTPWRGPLPFHMCYLWYWEGRNSILYVHMCNMGVLSHNTSEICGIVRHQYFTLSRVPFNRWLQYIWSRSASSPYTLSWNLRGAVINDITFITIY